MNSYLLFINGMFENPQDLDTFSKNFTDKMKSVNSPKFIIENKYNLIIIFDSDLDDEEISYEIRDNMPEEFIRLYFLFNRESLMIANVPQEISSIIFKDLPKDSALEVKLIDNETDSESTPLDNNDELYVDALLEKIDKFGIKSLTEKEKKYLDNFKK